MMELKYKSNVLIPEGSQCFSFELVGSLALKIQLAFIGAVQCTQDMQQGCFACT